jgi:pimeloyl-ACP methyl ester carboxylesterase
MGYYVLVNHVLPYSAIRPHRITHEEIAHHYPEAADPGITGMKFEPLDVTVEDSILLKGWFIYSKGEKALGSIILLHGIASSKESMLMFADTLTKHGYNCILYDSRAHGQSGGMNCTFGYYEKRDVSAYINSTLERFPAAGPFGVYGASLGAAIAIQAMAVDNRITCGVVVSPFATLREVTYDYWKRISGLPIHSIPNEVLKLSERIASFAVDSVKPEESARQVGAPVLVVHGDKDEKISIHYGERVFRNLQSPSKQLYVVVGAGHDNIEKIAGESYSRNIVEFFRVHLKK